MTAVELLAAIRSAGGDVRLASGRNLQVRHVPDDLKDELRRQASAVATELLYERLCSKFNLKPAGPLLRGLRWKPAAPPRVFRPEGQ
jgi:hypothetical protein